MAHSVTRAASMLDAIAAAPRTVRELADQFAVHRSTMFRELAALEQVGYVRRCPDGSYLLGLRLIALAQHALTDIDLREAAYPVVRELHRHVGNTVHVAGLIDAAIIYVDKVEDSAGVRMYSRVGAAVRPHCSAAGKAILAELDRSARDAVLTGVDWAPFTASTLTTPTELDAELAVVRSRGWAVDDGEFEEFVNCVAVPVRSSAGVVGAISLTAIRMVADLDVLSRQVPLLQRAAARVSTVLG